MFSSAVVGVAIGLIFVFLLLSLVCSGINELIASLLKLRASGLEKGLANLLGSDQTEQLYAHALIKPLYGKRRPSYMPSGKFALAVLDLVAPEAIGSGPPSAATRTSVTAALDGLPDANPLKKQLQVLWRATQADLDKFRVSVEGLFNDTMDRVSGWYKRKTQLILILIGAAVAVGMNVSTLTIAQRLWTDPSLRAVLVEQAKKVQPPASDSAGKTVGEATADVEQHLGQVEQLHLPIGWGTEQRPSRGQCLSTLAGWLLTAAALSLGAPFWFDLLKRVGGIRASGPPPPTTTGAAA